MNILIICRHHAAVAQATKVLRRIKTKTARDAKRPRPRAMILGPNRLARVLNNWNATSRIGNLLNVFHRRALADQQPVGARAVSRDRPALYRGRAGIVGAAAQGGSLKRDLIRLHQITFWLFVWA